METPTILPPSRDTTLATYFAAASALHNQGKLAEAAAEVRSALAIAPQSPEAHYNLANIVRDAGELELAAEGFKAAIGFAREKRHVYPDALINLGDVLNRLGKHKAAQDALQDALKLQPNRIEAHIGMALVLEGRNRLAAAISTLEAARELAPPGAAMLTHLAIARHRYGLLDEASEAAEAAIAADPNHAPAHYELANLRLGEGHMEAGYAEYEWRWKLPMLRGRLREFTAPRFDGSQSLEGRAILVHSELSFSDTIFFARYLPLLAARGARVIVLGEEPVLGILRSVPGVSACIGPAASLPIHDYVVAMGSVPRCLGIENDAGTDTMPYIRADERITAVWKQKLEDQKPIRWGMAWIPADPIGSRPMQMEQLAPLGLYRDVSLISLQQTRKDQQDAHGIHMPGLLPDFGLAAGLIDAMDAIVTVDTAVAHLAGAMGKPTCLMLPALSDWRWNEKGEKTRWYKSVRVFRQRRKGNWDDVIRRVDKALGSGLTKAE